jgi:dihydrofolate synthase/folylpolyglutamate synthase
VLDPLVAGVTSIGLDHTEYLGSTLEEIAGEKAGIFKRGRAAVVGETDVTIRELLTEHARRAGASPVRVASTEIELDEVDVDARGTICTLRWRGEGATLRTPLAGRHQAANLAVALTMLDAAGAPYAVSLAEAATHLDRVRIPGRFQLLGPYIFDVAHNPAGVEVVAQTLASVRPPEPIAVVLCVLRDKDWRGMMRVLSRVVSRFVLTTAPTAPASRAWNLEEALDFARSIGADALADADFQHALASARAGAATVLITGSFHTVGDAMSLLQVSPFSG